jgi:pyridoxal phosphate enzyme (YggS family)
VPASDSDNLSLVAANLAEVRRGIEAAARRAGREPREIALVAVSKTVAAEMIEAAVGAGQQVFGENRVQEAKAKWPSIRERHPQVELHLIGPLQTNKAAEAVRLFDCIQSLDRPKLAQALAAEVRKQGRHPAVYVQVNTGREPQKAGVLPEAADALISLAREELELNVQGVMCIPPLEGDPRPHFQLLAEIARRNELMHLSMGMSADFEAAIEEGATHVRVGTAIFGARD